MRRRAGAQARRQEGGRKAAELEREIRTALDRARPVLASGILGRQLTRMIEQHRKGKRR